MAKLHFIPFESENFADAEKAANRCLLRIIGIKVGRCRALVEAGVERDMDAAQERANAELFKRMFLKDSR